jgi:hypothetical protein
MLHCCDGALLPLCRATIADREVYVVYSVPAINRARRISD